MKFSTLESNYSTSRVLCLFKKKSKTLYLIMDEDTPSTPTSFRKCSKCPSKIPDTWKGTTCQRCRDKRKSYYANEKAKGKWEATAAMPQSGKRPREDAQEISEPTPKRVLTENHLNYLKSSPTTTASAEEQLGKQQGYGSEGEEDTSTVGIQY
jgi:hypothetical protein